MICFLFLVFFEILFNISNDCRTIFFIHTSLKQQKFRLLQTSDCRQSASGNSQVRSTFTILGAKAVYLSLFVAEPNSINPFWAFILASFFRFIHAKVSPTFISIRAFPNICVYRNPWFSFADPKIRSMFFF